MIKLSPEYRLIDFGDDRKGREGNPSRGSRFHG